MNIRGAIGIALESVWGKLLLLLLPMFIAGFIAIVTMREKIVRLESDVALMRSNYVTQEVLQVQLVAIRLEIAGLRQDLRDFRLR